jgi:molecular chaperone GrpE
MANEEKNMEQGVEIEIEGPETEQAEAEKKAEEPEDINAGAEPEPEDEESEDKAQETSDEDESARYMRLMADFQNYKRRVEKDKSDIYAYANEKLVTQLLEVLANFERALEHECADENYAAGMDLIFKQLTDVLSKSGLEEIKALGEDFDPNFHNAIMTEDNPDYESGKVTGVMQKGYMLNSKVIRPSMVKVNN